SQTFTSRSAPAEARRLPSGLKQTRSTWSPCLSSVWASLPVDASHSLTVRSLLAEASQRPSGLKATHHTASRWPRSVCSAGATSPRFCAPAGLPAASATRVPRSDLPGRRVQCCLIVVPSPLGNDAAGRPPRPAFCWRRRRASTVPKRRHPASGAGRPYNPPCRRSPRPPARAEPETPMPPKILIVDDEPDLEVLIRQRFRRQMREGVYDFTFARNGEEALAVVRAGGIDLVLSDINMPVMDGLTLLAHLRGLRPRLGAVIVSAYGDMRNIRSAMHLGAAAFPTKPIAFQDFEVTVAKTLRQVGELRQADADRDALVAVERDLQTAAEIQRSFLPGPLPEAARAGLGLHAQMLPA